jgi:hypothetical protein
MIDRLLITRKMSLILEDLAAMTRLSQLHQCVGKSIDKRLTARKNPLMVFYPVGCTMLVSILNSRA